MSSCKLLDSEAKWSSHTKTISRYGALLSTIYEISHDAPSLL